VVERLGNGVRVLVVRLRSLGDCVLTTPALRILKRTRPDLEILVVAEPRFAGVFAGNPDVSQVLEPSYTRVLRMRPELCLNLHGGSRSMYLTAASLSRFRAGFSHHVGAGIYSVKIPRAQLILGEERPVHTAEHLASALFYLGCPLGEIPPARLFSTQPLPSALSSLASSRYAVIHATSAAAYKTWTAEGFVTLARHLEHRHGVEAVFIGTAGDDFAPFGAYRRLAGAPLSEVIALLAGAAAFIGNDSGPAHMACALRVPVLVLYGRPEHAITWAPWRPVAARTLVDPSSVITNIPVERVIAALDSLLSERSG
jgi:heptosyltransferase III